MAREKSENLDKHNNHKSKVDKVLSQPGIRQAIDLVQQYALENAIDQTIEQVT
jgi:CII-binding regulator of phage lambda lysogenization HflD